MSSQADGEVDRCSVSAAEVFSFRVDVFTLGPDVFTLGPDVFTFRADVFSEAGERAEGRGVRRDEEGEEIPRSAGSGQVFGGRGGDGDVSTLSGLCVHFSG